MDINSLLSPSDASRASSLTPQIPAQSPIKHVQRSQSGPAKTSAANSSLHRAIQPPSSIPAHIRSPAQLPPNSSPLISPVTGGTVSTPQSLRTSSTQSMDTLADLASIQSRQPLQSTPPLISSHDSYDSQRSFHQSPLFQSTSAGLNPRASFDLSMVENPKPVMRGDFIGTSLSLESQQRLSALVTYTREVPSAYDSHIEIIKILHEGFVNHIYPSSSPNARRDPRLYDLLPDLRLARDTMDKLFAVGEEQWSDWVQDESILAQTAEERVEVVEKCRRAVEEEYGSPRLWMTYGDWLLHCYNWAYGDSGADNTSDAEKSLGKEIFGWDQVLEVWEQAIQQTKHDLSSSHLVWNEYLKVRFPKFDQNMSADEVKTAFEIFQARLQTPHGQWDNTFQMFSAFISANFSNEDYEGIMANTLRDASFSKQIWADRDEHESALLKTRNAGDKLSEYRSFSAYIEWEQQQIEKKVGKYKNKQTSGNSRVNGEEMVKALYQRAELRFPSVSEIWDSHFSRLVEKGQSGLLETLHRATKHCPWSGSLWKQYLLASELADEPFQNTENIKHNATKNGLLDMTDIQEALEVHDAWCGYLLRRTRRTDATEEDSDVAEMGIRSSIETLQSLAQKMGLPADFDVSFRLQRKYIEYLKGQGRLDNARQEFDNAVSVYGKHHEFWLKFYEFEMQKSVHIASLQKVSGEGIIWVSSAPFALAILKQGIEYPDLDRPDILAETLLRHCEDYEDAEELQKISILTRKVRASVDRNPQIERTVAAQDLTISDALQANNSGETTYPSTGDHVGKRKRDDLGLEIVDDANKRVRSDDHEPSIQSGANTDENLKRDREHTSVLVQNIPTDLPETKIRQYFSNCGTVVSLKSLHDEQNSFVIEFKEVEDAQYALSRNGQDLEGAILSVQSNAGSTLYVTNYRASADERYIRELFQPYGSIINVRFPSLQANKKRRFCYVEFKLQEDAQAALELDGRAIDGLEILVKVSNPAARQTRTERKNDGRTVFIGQLPFKATKEDLHDAFSSSGKIEHIKVPKDVNSKGRNKGIAFITFTDQAGAEAGLGMDGQELMGRKIKVTTAVDLTGTEKDDTHRRPRSSSPQVNGESHAASAMSPPPPPVTDTNPIDFEDRRQRSIAICDVPDTVNESRIRIIAETIGPVRKVNLKTNHQGAFIEFSTVADAGRAALELDGHEIDPGRNIRVVPPDELFQQRPERKSEKFGTGLSSRPKGNNPPPPPPPPPAGGNAPIRRPVQAGARKRGNLGRKVESDLRNPSSDSPNSSSMEVSGPKSNADFRGMLSQN